MGVMASYVSVPPFFFLFSLLLLFLADRAEKQLNIWEGQQGFYADKQRLQFLTKLTECLITPTVIPYHMCFTACAGGIKLLILNNK